MSACLLYSAKRGTSKSPCNHIPTAIDSALRWEKKVKRTESTTKRTAVIEARRESITKRTAVTEAGTRKERKTSETEAETETDIVIEIEIVVGTRKMARRIDIVIVARIRKK